MTHIIEVGSVCNRYSIANSERPELLFTSLKDNAEEFYAAYMKSYMEWCELKDLFANEY